MIEVDQNSSLFSEMRIAIEAGLESVPLGTHPDDLYKPVRYSLVNKGKRIRPLLTLLAGKIFGATPEGLLDAALAVEIFHSFTLVHDDIMDKSDTRRGRQTIHVKWSVSTAILVGDYLLGMTPGLLARSRPARLADILHRHGETVRVLCEGQVLDMGFETRRDVSVAEYLDMIDRKTGFLIQTSLMFGAFYGVSSDLELNMLSNLGFHFGRAFQIQDDLLDVTATSASWGKPVAGDLLSGKMTYLLTSVLEQRDTEHHEWWKTVVAAGKLPLEDIDLARDRLEKCGALQRSQEAAIFHFEKADSIMSGLPAGAATEALFELAKSLRKRKH